MGELGLNKIFGALLAAALLIMGLREVSSVFFGGGSHYHKEYESLNDWAEHSFSYFVEMADTGGSGSVEEEIYDLGLLLASADIGAGERSFKGKCSTCHTIEEGGANGTGPNLYNSIGVAKQHVAGFNYSGALAAVGGDWTYETMDEWLRAPARYARGTSMAFAGLSRDSERANVLAYLASYSPSAPEAPAPLPTEAEEVSETVEDSLVEAVTEGGAEVEAAVIEQAEGAEEAADTAVIEAAEDAVVETPSE